MRTKNRLYILMLLACSTGYIWLYYCFIHSKTEQATYGVCLIKKFTDIPCPSCGSTRSVILLSQGNFLDALLTNPFGYIVAIIMILAPLWIVFDILIKKSTFFEFYLKIEFYLKQQNIYIPFILLVLINWIWNIIKGL